MANSFYLMSNHRRRNAFYIHIVVFVVLPIQINRHRIADVHAGVMVEALASVFVKHTAAFDVAYHMIGMVAVDAHIGILFDTHNGSDFIIAVGYQPLPFDALAIVVDQKADPNAAKDGELCCWDFEIPFAQGWEQVKASCLKEKIPVAVTALSERAEDIRTASVENMAVVIGSEG